jgi:hypothetical protein
MRRMMMRRVVVDMNGFPPSILIRHDSCPAGGRRPVRLRYPREFDGVARRCNRSPGSSAARTF